jgi:hypothetical protein
MSLVHNLKLTTSHTLAGARTRLVSLLLCNLEASTSVMDCPIMFSRATFSPFLLLPPWAHLLPVKALHSLTIATWKLNLLTGAICRSRATSATEKRAFLLL